MQNISLLRLQLNHLVTQARQDIYSLSTMNDLQNSEQILQRLWDTISSIHFLSELLAIQASNNILTPQQPIQVQPGIANQIHQLNTPSPKHILPQPNQRILSIEELANYDGKNGRPAFVAVNNIIYDVTNNGAWAAATHFGLSAGKDHTMGFASCHTGQQSLLDTLPVVGRLV